MTISRRRFCAGLAGVSLAQAAPFPALAGRHPAEESLRRLEHERKVRLGVAVFDAQTGSGFGHREHERFPMCSTFKFLAAAAILAKVDAGALDLQSRVEYQKSDLVENSPATEHHVADGMALGELCHAMITVSDNTAANLVMANFLGGPAGVTAYARSLGDGKTRLDRIETELNEAVPGDPRDTTTPAAMLGNLCTLLLGDALSAAARARLSGWLLANTTGGARLKAGLPADWRIGDKTGAGGHGTTNDIAILWPPDRAPLLVAAYQTGSAGTWDERNAVIAEVGRVVAASLEPAGKRG